MVQYFNNPRDRSRPALLAVAPWTPADLGSALKWWMDPRFGIYTDAGSTPATADGDLIYRWVCQASGMIFDQSTSGARPTLKIGANGKREVEFASGKYLTCASHSLPTGGSARSFSTATKWAGVPWENNFPWSYGTPGNNFTYSLSVVSGNWSIVAYNNDWTSSGLAASTSVRQIVDSVYDGSGNDLRIDNGTPATTTPTAYNTQAGAAYLGLFTTTGERYVGRIGHHVMTNTALSSGDRASLLAFQQAQQAT